jgi:hypothetical protein
MLRTNLTLVEDVLTCCPPGPPERAKLTVTAAAGTRNPWGVL